MLEKFEILNGSIDQEFDKNVLNYEVSVDSSVSTLLFNYKISEGSTITIYGNNDLQEGINHILLEVFNERVTTYKITVNKEKLQQTIAINNDSIENKENFLNIYKLPIVSISCLVIIVILYVIIFRKKK